MSSPDCRSFPLSITSPLRLTWHTGDMSQLPVKPPASDLTRSASVMGAVVAFMWVLELFDTASMNLLDGFGIVPRDPASLPMILSAPFLHYGWGHLMSNTVPLFVLGTLVLVSGLREFVWVSLITVLSSGAAVWLISPTNSITLGASGVVFGYLTYLLVRGFFTRSWGQLAIALIVGFVYGGILWGVLPTAAGASWQGHLGGAIGGVLAAVVLHRRVTTS